MWSPGTESSVVIRIHSFVVSFSAPTTADGLTKGAGIPSMHPRRAAESVKRQRKDGVALQIGLARELAG
jgi:hypothetical protein